MTSRSAPDSEATILDRPIKNSSSAFALRGAVQVTLILAITIIAIALPAVQRDLDLRPGELALVSAKIVAAVGLMLVMQLGVETPYIGTFLAGLLVFPVGAALTFAGGAVAVLDGAERDHAGVAGGILNTAVELGPTAGLAALVSVAGTHTAHLLESGRGLQAATTAGYAFALTSAAAVFAAATVLPVLGLRRPVSRLAQASNPTTEGDVQ